MKAIATDTQRSYASHHPDVAIGQHRLELIADGGPEDVERATLRRRDDDITAVLRRQQRELVERESPRHSARGRVRDALDLALGECVRDALHVVGVTVVAEHDGARDGGGRSCADGDDCDVVIHDGTRGEADAMRLRRDCFRDVAAHSGSHVRGQAGEVIGVDARGTERRARGCRPELETSVGRDELQIHALLGECSQREQQLRGGKPTSDDHNT